MRDNHPRKRQQRAAEHKLVRAKASRHGLPVFLIVCEGTQTEPNYLRGLCESRRINMANVCITAGGTATDALSLVKKARQLFTANGNDYDRVFVVVDDEGQSLVQARYLAGKRLKTAGGESVQIELIASRPSFEFWLLLHFEYSSRPYDSAAIVIDQLQAHLTNYSKADSRLFKQVEPGLDRALVNVERLKQELASSGSGNPNTDMHVLIAGLLSLVREN